MKNLLFLLCFLPLLSWSQMVIKERDGFIYATTNSVEFLNGQYKGLLKCTLSKYFEPQTKKYTYDLSLVFRDRDKHDLKGGEKVLFKFSDNSILELENINDRYASYSSSGYYNSFICDLTKEQIEQIKDKSLLKLRLGFYQPKDYEIKESQAVDFKKIIQDLLNCDLEKTKKEDIDIYKGF